MSACLFRQMRDPAQACKNTIVPCEVQELSSERASFQQPGINEEFVKVQPLRPSRIQVDPGNPDHISGFTVVVDPVCLSFMVYEHEYDVHPGREGESERVSCQYRFLSHRLIVKVGHPAFHHLGPGVRIFRETDPSQSKQHDSDQPQHSPFLHLYSY
ncbi:MAG: hypothetical protein FVQ86_02720 [candidate division NC10 bacterium]|nr:hypothetical protein [candidate division NC10 bacterium]